MCHCAHVAAFHTALYLHASYRGRVRTSMVHERKAREAFAAAGASKHQADVALELAYPA